LIAKITKYGFSSYRVTIKQGLSTISETVTANDVCTLIDALQNDFAHVSEEIETTEDAPVTLQSEDLVLHDTLGNDCRPIPEHPYFGCVHEFERPSDGHTPKTDPAFDLLKKPCQHSPSCAHNFDFEVSGIRGEFKK